MDSRILIIFAVILSITLAFDGIMHLWHIITERTISHVDRDIVVAAMSAIAITIEAAKLNKHIHDALVADKESRVKLHDRYAKVVDDFFDYLVDTGTSDAINTFDDYREKLNINSK